MDKHARHAAKPKSLDLRMRMSLRANSTLRQLQNEPISRGRSLCRLRHVTAGAETFFSRVSNLSSYGSRNAHVLRGIIAHTAVLARPPAFPWFQASNRSLCSDLSEPDATRTEKAVTRSPRSTVVDEKGWRGKRRSEFIFCDMCFAVSQQLAALECRMHQSTTPLSFTAMNLMKFHVEVSEILSAAMCRRRHVSRTSKLSILCRTLGS